jgi:hypothetical protein
MLTAIVQALAGAVWTAAYVCLVYDAFRESIFYTPPP